MSGKYSEPILVKCQKGLQLLLGKILSLGLAMAMASPERLFTIILLRPLGFLDPWQPRSRGTSSVSASALEGT